MTGYFKATAVARDLITDDQYQTLAGPWETVFGPFTGGAA